MIRIIIVSVDLYNKHVKGLYRVKKIKTIQERDPTVYVYDYVTVYVQVDTVITVFLKRWQCEHHGA